MKIEIQNLGPIHHFEFDLEKDLHLLYGENNVGKSFAASTIYCLIKNLMTDSHLDSHKNILPVFSSPNALDVFKEMETSFAKCNEGEEKSINRYAETIFKSAFETALRTKNLTHSKNHFASSLKQGITLRERDTHV